MKEIVIKCMHVYEIFSAIVHLHFCEMEFRHVWKEKKKGKNLLVRETFIITRGTWSLFAFCFSVLLTTSEVRSQEPVIKAVFG